MFDCTLLLFAVRNARLPNATFHSQFLSQAKCESSTNTWNLAEAEAEVAGGKRKRALQHLRAIIDTLPKQRPGTAASRAARDAAETAQLAVARQRLYETPL